MRGGWAGDGTYEDEFVLCSVRWVRNRGVICTELEDHGPAVLHNNTVVHWSEAEVYHG